MFKWYRNYISVLTKKHWKKFIILSICIDLPILFVFINRYSQSLFEFSESYPMFFFSALYIIATLTAKLEQLAYVFWLRRYRTRELANPKKFIKRKEKYRFLEGLFFNAFGLAIILVGAWGGKGNFIVSFSPLIVALMILFIWKRTRRWLYKKMNRRKSKITETLAGQF